MFQQMLTTLGYLPKFNYGWHTKKSKEEHIKRSEYNFKKLTRVKIAMDAQYVNKFLGAVVLIFITLNAIYVFHPHLVEMKSLSYTYSEWWIRI